MGFKAWFEQQDVMQRYNHINPDDLFSQVFCLTFIYTNKHELISQDCRNDKTHFHLIRKYPKELGVQNFDPINDDIFPIRRALELKHLFGRVGVRLIHEIPGQVDSRKNQLFCSFWNHKASLYTTLLKHCLQKLLSDKVIQGDTIITAPVFPVAQYVKDILGGQINTTEDETIQQQWLQAKNLHLAPQAIKKQFLPPGKKSDWQAAIEKNRLITPGAKFWSMYGDHRT